MSNNVCIGWYSITKHFHLIKVWLTLPMFHLSHVYNFLNVCRLLTILRVSHWFQYKRLRIKLPEINGHPRTLRILYGRILENLRNCKTRSTKLMDRSNLWESFVPKNCKTNGIESFHRLFIVSELFIHKKKYCNP